MKDLLIDREHREMNKERNSNLREYLLTIESEYIPEAYEQDNYYLIKYTILDLESLKPVTIKEQVKELDIDNKIAKPLYDIIHECNHNLSYTFSYKALINNGWLETQYLFEAIPLKESISSLNDLLIIPSSEKAIIHYLKEINYNLECISTSIEEHRLSNCDNLEQIGKGLDLSNYLVQH